MSETWILKTADGEKFWLQTEPYKGGAGGEYPYKSAYNLLAGVNGHRGMPVSIKTDAVPGRAGGEINELTREVRQVYLPLHVRGTDEADMEKNFERLRTSFVPESEAELWVTNERGRTRVLYCRYQSGFEKATDDENRGTNWINVPLYVYAADPWWYDPPGSEITRNYVQEPWNDKFFTFCVQRALTADAHVGDTSLAVTDSTNLKVGKTIELHGGLYRTSDETLMLAHTQKVPAKKRQTKKQKALRAVYNPPATSMTIAVDSDVVQLGQSINVRGEVRDSSGNLVTGTYTTLLNIKGSNSSFAEENIGFVTGGGKWSGSVNTNATMVGELRLQGRFLADEIFFQGCYSPTITVEVGSGGSVETGAGTQPTELTATSSIAHPNTGQAFYIQGNLTTNGTGLGGEKVFLYRKTISGNKLLGSTTTATSTGAYSIKVTESQSQIAQYIVTFQGETATYCTDTTIDYDIQTAALWRWVTTTITQVISQVQSVGNVTGSGNVINFAAQTAVNSVSSGYGYGYSYTKRLVSAGYKAATATVIVKIGSDAYPMVYQVAMPPAMVRDGELQYFGYNNFATIILIAETSGSNYATELGLIEANGLYPAIDISAVVKDQTLPISTWSTWLNSLASAGWSVIYGQNVAGGRTGDPAYIKNKGFKYVNMNPMPVSGTDLNPDAFGSSTTRNAFRFCNSSEAQPIMDCTTAAYAHSIGSGIMACVWKDDSSANNECAACSVAGVPPSYMTMLDWSVINGVMMDTFTVYFAPNYSATTPNDYEPEQLDIYKSLGFPAIVDELQGFYEPAKELDGVGPWTWLSSVSPVGDILTVSFTDIPLVLTGTLYNVQTGAALANQSITFSLYKHANVASATSGAAYVTVDDLGDFYANDSITIANNSNSETHAIDHLDVPNKRIYLKSTSTLAHSYTGASVTCTQALAPVATTNSTGAWKMAFVGDYALPVGKHNIVSSFAGGSVGGKTYMAYHAPTPYGLTLYHQITVTIEEARELHTVKSIDSPHSISLAEPVENEYHMIGDPYVLEYDMKDKWLTQDALTDSIIATELSAGDNVVVIASTANSKVGNTCRVLGYDSAGAWHCEENRVAAILSGTEIQLVNNLTYGYVMTHTDCTFTDEDGAHICTTEGEYMEDLDKVYRSAADGLDYVIFWMIGCPPCMKALSQLDTMVNDYPNVSVHKYEIHILNADGTLNTDILAGELLYPELFAAAQACGPAPPDPPYHVVGNPRIMPAVIGLYRDGIFVRSWCGVHTTGCDPVPTSTLIDTGGNRVGWRLGKAFAGKTDILTNDGGAPCYGVWRVTGPGTWPRLVNVTTGMAFVVDHELQEGETVLVDFTEGAHSCQSDRMAIFTGSGYMKPEQCPTCHGTGVISSCATCGGDQVCPTCHGTGEVQVWVPAQQISAGAGAAAGLFNIRNQVDPVNRDWWPFAVGANVVDIEMADTDVGVSAISLDLIRRYDGP